MAVSIVESEELSCLAVFGCHLRTRTRIDLSAYLSI